MERIDATHVILIAIILWLSWLNWLNWKFLSDTHGLFSGETQIANASDLKRLIISKTNYTNNVVDGSVSDKIYTSTKVKLQEANTHGDQIETVFDIAHAPSMAPTYALPRPHPHAGARFANGTFGYVADPTLVRRTYLKEFYSSQFEQPLNTFLKLSETELNRVCGDPPGKGFEKKGYKLLMKVVVNKTEHVADNATAQEPKAPIRRKSKAPRILCAVYTFPENHHQIEAIIDTWGWRCDGFIAASTITNETLGIVDIPHLGPEAYWNMWQKLRSIWAYLGDNYIDDYDFFWVGGDDAQLIIDNLLNYLWDIRDSIGEQRLLTESIYLGGLAPLKPGLRDVTDAGSYFVHGAAGYVINRFTLKKIVSEKTKKSVGRCHTREVKMSAEDRNLSLCLKAVGIGGNDTVDELGSQRFLFTSPQFIAQLDYEYMNRMRDTNFNKKILQLWTLRNGPRWKEDMVSSDTIAFHSSKYPVAMKRIHAILYNSCPPGTVLGDVE